jgi:hypothetical protein
MMEVQVPNLGRSFLLASAILACSAVAASAGTSFAYDGSYAGSMTVVGAASQVGAEQPACVNVRPVNMVIDRGSVTFWYAGAAGDVLHYRGAVNESGVVDAWHRNGDGSHTVLIGGIGGPGFVGYLDREDGSCRYRIIMRTAPAN